MKNLSALVPLLTAAAILLAGNGIQGTLIALRAVEEGFRTTSVGLIGTAYFVGFITACIYAPRLVQAVGHIRVFSALAAVAAAGTLVLVLAPDPVVWLVVRFIMGFCFSGLFTVIESWLSQRADDASRARLLAVYRIIDMLVVTGSQFLIGATGVSGFAIFAITAILFALSLVPVSLGDRSQPKPPESFRFDLPLIWRLSPLACSVCVTIGLTNGAFRLVGPLYARDIGLDLSGIAFFMAAGIFGGSVLQYPFGWASDRFDRRWAILVATAGATVAGLYLTVVDGDTPLRVYTGAFFFGAFAMPLYSLAVAHANDRASFDDYILVSAGLTFFYSIGASVGPAAASAIIERFGGPAFFTYTSVLHGSLIAVGLMRMISTPPSPASRRVRFVSLLRTSPSMVRLARRAARRRH
ncbi:MFS family permease [Rhodobium orientis]|uniref:MFS transporter n=1 Tax=Rhodobium orientis TaxID=34017 RepID=A0A327JR75_9HYPH|nr:MFS transporter [Rhodobium orientis]MBB4302189.1 MFS family permease [Rhodobium orientis]MBK5948900.1 MFS transporter [Rhodobium orientis]RAI27913.1 MFS transporter [Rhodobium orientis]